MHAWDTVVRWSCLVVFYLLVFTLYSNTLYLSHSVTVFLPCSLTIATVYKQRFCWSQVHCQGVGMDQSLH